MLRTISVGCWGRAFAEVAKAAFQRPDQCTAYHHLTQRRGSQTPGRWLSALRSRPREEWVRRDARCDKQELSVGRAVLVSVHSFRARGRAARVASLPRVPEPGNRCKGHGRSNQSRLGVGVQGWHARCRAAYLRLVVARLAPVLSGDFVQRRDANRQLDSGSINPGIALIPELETRPPHPFWCTRKPPPFHGPK